MQKTLLTKLLMIGGLFILLLLPFMMIDGLINERQYHHYTTVEDIAQSWTGSQTVTGVLLVAPYKEKVMRQTEIYKDGKKQTTQKEEIVTRHKYFLPEHIDIKGDIETEERYRGIFKVPVYTSHLQFKGQFELPKQLGITENLDKITWEKPFIVLGVQDIRGINQSVKLMVNAEDVELQPGSRSPIIEQGIHGRLDLDYQKDASLNFEMAFELQGMEELSFLPTGKTTKITLSSPWPHPSFMGRYLPKSREISGDGFVATWETSFFSTSIGKHLEQCARNNNCLAFATNTLGVQLHEGVDIYLQAERSIKYALLFVGLTFTAFFMFEVLKGLRIHPVQYGLVGVALALFYLLLISLSEHISFVAAYVIASAACIGLISFYVSFVLKSWKRGAMFAGLLAALYGTLYTLIRSEDYALLMGTGLLFGVLCLIMVITRNIDWYKIEASAKDQLLKPKAAEV